MILHFDYRLAWIAVTAVRRGNALGQLHTSRDLVLDTLARVAHAHGPRSEHEGSPIVARNASARFSCVDCDRPNFRPQGYATARFSRSPEGTELSTSEGPSVSGFASKWAELTYPATAPRRSLLMTRRAEN